MSKRERNIAIAALVVLGLLALDQVVLSPLFERTELAQARAAAAQQEVAAANQTLQRQLLERRRWKKVGGETLRPTAAAAEGQLVNRVPAWAAESGLSLTSIRPDRVDAAEGFGRISLRVTATGGLADVGRFLFAVENADVPVRVSDFALVTREEGEDDLSMQLTLATIYDLPRETEP